MLRNVFEHIYAKRHNIEDVASLISLRTDKGYSDKHVDDCWFFFMAALSQ